MPALVTYLALSVSQGGPKGPSVLEQLKLPMPLPASLIPFGVTTRNPISSSSDTSEIGVFLVVFLVKVLEFAGVGEWGDIGPHWDRYAIQYLRISEIPCIYLKMSRFKIC